MHGRGFSLLAGLHSFHVLACLDHHLNDLDDLGTEGLAGVVEFPMDELVPSGR
jgi:hypothetical protein